MSKDERLAAANDLLLQISKVGRRFFYNSKHDRIARFEITPNGKLWFRDDYTDKLVYVAYTGRWKQFSHGGTLRRLIEELAEYIRTGARLAPGHFGPWPKYICRGDLWGYGTEAMATLRGAILTNDCVAWSPKSRAA